MKTNGWLLKSGLWLFYTQISSISDNCFFSHHNSAKKFSLRRPERALLDLAGPTPFLLHHDASLLYAGCVASAYACVFANFYSTSKIFLNFLLLKWRKFFAFALRLICCWDVFVYFLLLLFISWIGFVRWISSNRSRGPCTRCILESSRCSQNRSPVPWFGHQEWGSLLSLAAIGVLVRREERFLFLYLAANTSQFGNCTSVGPFVLCTMCCVTAMITNDDDVWDGSVWYNRHYNCTIVFMD